MPCLLKYHTNTSKVFQKNITHRHVLKREPYLVLLLSSYVLHICTRMFVNWQFLLTEQAATRSLCNSGSREISWKCTQREIKGKQGPYFVTISAIHSSHILILVCTHIRGRAPKDVNACKPPHHMLVFLFRNRSLGITEDKNGKDSKKKKNRYKMWPQRNISILWVGHTSWCPRDIIPFKATKTTQHT